MTILTNWTLHEEFGFGKARLQKFQDIMARWMAYLGNDTFDMSFEEMAEQLKEETGFDTYWDMEHRLYDKEGEVINKGGQR